MTEQVFYTSAAGNSFFLTFSQSLDFPGLKSLAKSKGIDPDGYVFVKWQDSKTDMSWEFWNKDGGTVDFCGNALRSIGLCANHQKNSRGPFVLKSENHEPLEILVLNKNLVRAQMPLPKGLESISLESLSLEANHVLAGVPHLVFNVSDPHGRMSELRELSLKIRGLDLNGRQSYNLTFYDKVVESSYKAVTFERGVEDFTQACGSGALSVAETLKIDNVEITMPGGTLTISKRDEALFMEGQAEIIKTFDFEEN